MRVSTNQIYDAGAQGIQQSHSALFKLNNQLATGRRVLTPQDDPVAAAQALVVTQSKEVNQQYINNQGQAKHQLALVDSQLNSITSLLNNVRDKVIQAGNTILTQPDRNAIASEVEARLAELVGIANSDNGIGEFLFSGFSGNVKPFAATATTATPPATTPPIQYFGDNGERLIQVSSSRQMSVNVSGNDLFMSPKQGNGTFVAQAATTNTGSGVVDTGSVLNPQQWATAVNNTAAVGTPLEIRFSNDANGRPQYQIHDPVGGLGATIPFVSGQAIPLVSASGDNFGAQVIITGQPAVGDRFTVKASTSQSMFQTLQNLLGVLRNPVNAATYTSTQYANQLNAELTNIDQALGNVSRIQSDIGVKRQEIDSLNNTLSDLDIQYQSNLSELQDLDYNKAISDFIKQQINLEAAQKSFAQISGLSLFKYL